MKCRLFILPNLTEYTLTNVPVTLVRIIRRGENGWYNYMNKCEILPNQKAKYSLTINKTRDSSIMVGFCTEKGMGNVNNQNHA
jgi:hypothetical protein